MNGEEYRMNKGLLQEIAQYKKIERSSCRGSVESLEQNI